MNEPDCMTARKLNAKKMTPADLREWIKRRRLSHREAADLLAMSREALRKNLYGVTEIGAQTIRIMELLDEPKSQKS